MSDVMVRRWKFCTILLFWAEIYCILCIEKQRSTRLSVTLRRKLKHHLHRNNSLNSPITSSITNPEDDGKEFTLRVSIWKDITHFYFCCFFIDDFDIFISPKILSLTEHLVCICHGTRPRNTAPNGKQLYCIIIS